MGAEIVLELRDELRVGAGYEGDGLRLAMKAACAGRIAKPTYRVAIMLLID